MASSRVGRDTSYNRAFELKHTTMREIFEITSNKLNLIYYLMEKGILTKSYKCPACFEEMYLCESTSAKVSSDGYIWKCNKTVNGRRHQKERSLRRGSWIQDCNFTLEEIVKITYCWSKDYTQKQVSKNKPNFKAKHQQDIMVYVY
jgi:hypothetical protein